MRLDQFVSQATGLSRSQVQKLIRQGKVRVDQTIVKAAKTKVDNFQQVSLNEQVLTLPQPVYLMLNKPAGYVSATQDSQHPTVLDLIEHPQKEKLHIVGRLDKDTTGLLLITDDGEWTHCMMSPKHHVTKTYLVTLAEALTEEASKQLQQGILLKNEEKPTLPANVEKIEDKLITLSINEGRYHQVKRMLAAVENHVLALHRLQIGELCLDKSLAIGEYRELSEQEYHLALGLIS